MRLLMLKESLPIGGAERQLALLMKHLPPEWDRRVWLMDDGPFADAIAADGFRVHVARREARYDARPAASLWRLLLEWRPEVVHSWDWMSTFAAVPLCRLLDIPIVDATIRNGIVRRKGSLQRRLSQAASALVVANSQAGLTAWGVGPQKGRVVYNAFDPARLSALGPSAAPARSVDAIQTVVMTGRMVAHKDFSSLIGAARLLDGRQPGRWRVLLLGNGPDRARLAVEAAALQDRGVVTMVDPGMNVLPHLPGADVGVLMSRETQHREGCSNAIMEYMSCGLPVVCTSGGGNPELVRDGETGYLVPAGDARALADALAFLADHPDTARRLGDAGRRRVLEEFSIPRLTRAMERVYLEALS